MIPNTGIKLPEAGILEHWVEKGAEQYNGNPIPYYPTDNAPSNYEQLRQWANENRVGVDPLPVFSGGCNQTIFGSENGNYLFRSWHDSIHINEGLSFSLKDELKVSDFHCEILKYVGAPYAVIKAIEADVKGQILYYSVTGEYVKNQSQFVGDCLKHGIDNVINSVQMGLIY